MPVLCYGLRIDFQNHLFTGFRRLMGISDIIEEVPTVCWCGKCAQCNTRYSNGRIVREGKHILVLMKVMWHFVGNIIKRGNYGKRINIRIIADLNLMT